jgi:Cu+-exporting ATPase
MKKIILQIAGMHCASCEKIIEMELKEVVGVETVKVDHKTGEAVIEARPETDKNAILEAVKRAGYEAQINL